MKENKDKEIDRGLKLLAKSSVIVFVGIFLSKIFSFVYRITIANSLGSEIYGRFSLALMIMVLFISLSSLGLQEGLSRYIPFYRGKNEKEKIKHIFRYSLMIVFFSSFSLAILLFLFSEIISINLFNSPGLTIFLKWFAVFIPISVFAGFFHLPLRAYEKIKWHVFIPHILQPFVQVFSLLILIFLGFKASAVIFSYNLGYLTIFLVSFFVCRYYFKFLFKKTKLNKKIKSQTNQKLFSFSWPLIFLGLVVFLFMYMDSFVIGYFKGVSQVGIYNSAVPLAVLISIAPVLFLQLFYPLIVKEYARKNTKLIKELSKQVVKWIFLINLPFVLIMLFFPGEVINLFFKPEYLVAANSLRFLSIGMFFYSIFVISENLLSMVGKSKIILKNLLITVTLNLVLNIILIPKFGITGAAFSTMISYIFWSFLTLIQTRKHTLIIPLKRKMLSIFLVSLIPLLFLFVFKQIMPITKLTLILQGIFFLLLYFLLIFLTGCFDKNDLMILQAIKKKIKFLKPKP